MRERRHAVDHGVLCVALTLLSLCCAGFDWPRRAERLVNALTAATSARDKRDALRMLRELHAREGIPPTLDLQAVEQATGQADPEVRAEAWALLSGVRSDPSARAAALEAALRDPAVPVRLSATALLGAAASDDELLVRAVTDSDAKVRAAGVRHLATLDDVRALPLLLSALREQSLEVRGEAVRALAARGEPAAVDALLAAADDTLPELRAAALDGLELTTGERGRQTCQRALDDIDEAVVLAALRCLWRWRSGAPQTEHAALREARDVRVDARLRALSASMSPSIAAAATRQLSVRPSFARKRSDELPWLSFLEQTADPALKGVAAERVLARLEQLLPPGERLSADPLLLWLPRAAPSLRPRIGALIERSRAELAPGPIVALLDLPPPPPRSDVRPGLYSNAATLRATYVRLLAQSPRAESRARALAALDDRAREVRQAAVLALSRTATSEELLALGERLPHGEPEQRRDVLRVWTATLARRAERPPVALPAAVQRALVGPLSRELARHDELCAALAIRALGQLDLERSRALLRQVLEDPRAARQIAALRASVRDRSPEARALRLAQVAHLDPRVSATALIAVTLAGDPLPRATAISWLENAAWPRGPAASFALTQASVSADQPAGAPTDFDPCRWTSSREPITRGNMLVACARQQGENARFPRAAHFDAPHTARVAGEPAALIREDSRTIVSWPDASDHVYWDGEGAVHEVSAFLRRPPGR